MKLLTWNLNGLRATKIPLKKLLNDLAADIICLQETKITKDQLESDLALIEGYSSYFSFSQTRQGYSGVATYCRDGATPTNAQEGLFDFYEKKAGDKNIGQYGNLNEIFTKERALELDREGRTIITQHEFKTRENLLRKLTIFNVYCPRADPEKPQRKEYKMDFYIALEERAKAVLESGSHVIICGDINTSHRRIDHCDPDGPELFYDNPFREWMDDLLFHKGDYSRLKYDGDSIKGNSEDRGQRSTKTENLKSSSLGCTTCTHNNKGPAKTTVQSLKLVDSENTTLLGVQTEDNKSVGMIDSQRIYGLEADLHPEDEMVDSQRIFGSEIENRDAIYSEDSGNFSNSDNLSSGGIVTGELSDTESGRYFVDTFRYFFPNRKDAFTCWSTLKGCRQTNYGTRIDYIFADAHFHVKYLKNCDIHPDIDGSDHCPVKAEIGITIIPSTRCPPCCTKFMPDFSGKQQTLSKFFSKKTANSFEHIANQFAVKSTVKTSTAASKRKLPCTKSNSRSGKQLKLNFFAKNEFQKPKGESPAKISSSPKMADQKLKPPPRNKNGGMINEAGEAPNQNPKPQAKVLHSPTFEKKKQIKKDASSFWKSVLKGPDPSPLCTGHNEPSLLRTVKKEGPNLGKQFYVCCRPEGHKNNPIARCSFFQWNLKKK